MDALYLPTESDFKRWVKEAVQEYFQSRIIPNASIPNEIDEMISRKELATILQISLVTLTDWMKRGLPFYKQRGRVYFIKSEVLMYIQKKGKLEGIIFSESA